MSTAATHEARSARPEQPGAAGRAGLRSVGAGAWEGSDGAGSVDELGLVDALSSMAETLRQLTRDFPMWSLPEAQVGEAVGHVHAVRELSQSLTAVLAREADARGLGAADGLSRADWLRVQAGAGVAGGVLDGSGAAAVTRVGAAMNEPRWARLAERVAAAEVPVAHAAAIIRFHDDVARIADPDHLADILDSMVEACDVLTGRELARLVAHARATLKPPAEREVEEAGLRLGRAFRKVRSCAGFTVFELRLEPEGAAIVEAAIDRLSRPRPDLVPDLGLDGAGGGGALGDSGRRSGTGAGEVDPRTPATRRADALLEIIGRGVAAPEGVTRSPRTTLVVTMSLDALTDSLRGVGLLDTDAALSPGAVRRLACEAGIVPMVLGGRSELLDLGYTQRLFSPAQRRALAVRDGGCSYPGCTVPPMWCEAHHVTHWLHGGPTDLSNGALLCGRHHTVVHQRGLSGSVTTTGVSWHL
ncbi:HNH endonuclease signature motif containing protein [Terrabacter sp. Ter38]|uniref:HNH endonuclease signature motif containing protein n=1 Tax=Terrabacter sp. Ter38 TaxID=2926030 RepID=UPI0021197FC3|nr:HNH endonuclease signature motif containing protein [Terrabacter sp. Ter38]